MNKWDTVPIKDDESFEEWDARMEAELEDVERGFESNKDSSPEIGVDLLSSVKDMTIRPSCLSGFIGQNHIKEQLKAAIAFAKLKGKPLEHVLILGPKGLGKTTLANVIANELGLVIQPMLGGELSNEEVRSILVNMSGQGQSILFIDEIHRLPKKSQECLYRAMEDYVLEYRLNLSEYTVPIITPIGPFTMIGATTEEDALTPSFVERFGIVLRLELYGLQDLSQIIVNYSKDIGLVVSPEVAITIASYSRGTPRVARNMVRRVRDFAPSSSITVEDITRTVSAIGLDHLGLNRLDRQYLQAIKTRGGVCSQATIASVVQERPATLTHSVEPYLLRLGLIVVTSRGRQLTTTGFSHIR